MPQLLKGLCFRDTQWLQLEDSPSGSGSSISGAFCTWTFSQWLKLLSVIDLNYLCSGWLQESKAKCRSYYMWIIVSTWNLMSCHGWSFSKLARKCDSFLACCPFWEERDSKSEECPVVLEHCCAPVLVGVKCGRMEPCSCVVKFLWPLSLPSAMCA